MTKIVLDFFKAIYISGLRDFYVRWSLRPRLLQVVEDYEKLHGILLVIGAIDGSHIPVIGRIKNHVDSFNWKGFHSILLPMWHQNYDV